MIDLGRVENAFDGQFILIEYYQNTENFQF